MEKIIYNVSDKPPVGKLLFGSFQQLLAILAATIAVPNIIGNGMSTSAALLGAGVGTIVYLLFTRFKSPVFLGSSFSYLGSMASAFAGAASISIGYLGLIMGASFAGLVYVILALITKKFGTKWMDKVLPPVVIGPVVSIIGLTLAPNAVSDLFASNVVNGHYIAMVIGLITLFTTIIVSLAAKKTFKLIPFIIGIGAGYALAAILTLIGNLADVDILKIIDFSKFENMKWVPDFTFVEAFKGFSDFSGAGEFFTYFITVIVAYIPVAFVSFAEHIADHKNLSSIIGKDLIKDPGLDKTLLGDGVGSIAGAFFGGCPNTTYGESIGCVALSGNASIYTIFMAAIMAIIISFFAPFITLLSTIPSCVMGGVCMALYGFIAVSGLKMLKNVDLSDNGNIYIISVILIAGIGSFMLTIDKVTLTPVASALILGVITNFIVNFIRRKRPEKSNDKE